MYFAFTAIGSFVNNLSQTLMTKDSDEGKISTSSRCSESEWAIYWLESGSVHHVPL